MTLSASSRRRFAFLTAVSLVAGTAGALAVATPAMAATITVLNTNDSGAGSLRDAIATASAGDTIVFDGSLASSTIQIATPLVVTETLTISGLGSGTLSIATTASSDYFRFEPTSASQDFTLSGITVQGNNVNTGSGVVATDTVATPRNVTVVDVTFTDLVNSSIGGPAILVDTIAGTLRAEDSRFFDNVGGADGGAISAIDVGSAIVLTDNVFTGNEAAGSGGAVLIDSPSADATLTDNEFTDNTAVSSGAGGAVWVSRADEVVINGGSFTNNVADNSGGGVGVSRAATVTVTGTLFDTNSSISGRGGGFAGGGFSGGLITLADTTFTGNFGDIAGGGFSTIGDVPVLIQDSTFRGNESNGNGGGVYASGSVTSYTVERSTFEANVTGLNGAGLYLDNLDADGEFSVHSSTFFDNDVDDFGAALALASINGVATIINSTLNEPQSGAGFAVVSSVFAGGELRIRYSTIVGGVLMEDNEGTVDILSSIVDGDTQPAVSVIFGGDPVDVSYSLLSSALTAQITDGGNNQFSVADFKLGPLQDNGGPTFTRLPLAGSPAIDRGFPGGTPPTFDQRYTGFPRVLGGRVDIGAVESSVLAATGQTINLWIPIAGGVLLLGGVAAITVSALRRRRLG